MTPGTIRRHVAVLATGCLLAAGCSLLAPLPSRSRFLTLTPLPEAHAGPAEAPRRDAGSGILYGLGPVKLVAYLDRNEVATRMSPTEVRYSPVDRWAEPLPAAITSVMLQNLSALLETDRIVAYPWLGAVKIDYQVEVGVLRFETDDQGVSRLTARWAIMDVGKSTYVVVKESTYSRTGLPGNATTSAADLSAVLGDLSREIAGALRSLPLPAPEPTPARRRQWK